MSKVIVVSKTHLDLGFTAMASEILVNYCNSHFPRAIEVASEVNASSKRFVWTVGAWLLKEMLEIGSESQSAELRRACHAGDIVAHAMPFTTHTELMDVDLVEYGLSIVKELDREFGRKTIAAKMTDVPGHSIALVPILARAGIKLLHIGVNAASAVPQVPPAFVWRKDNAEIVVIYEGSYGGEFCTDAIGDILYFDHLLDNCGPRGKQSVLSNFNAIKARYSGHEVVAGTLDDYAELLWAARDKLPVITQEIGDSWIHGGATDPYKIAAFKELLTLKNEWIAAGSMARDTVEYNRLMDGLLCIAEHTWGSDSKVFFGDNDNYLKSDFEEARASDTIIKRRGLYRLKVMRKLAHKGKVGRYARIERCWQEQRDYLDKAMSCLSDSHRGEAHERLELLLPQSYTPDFRAVYQSGELLTVGETTIAINALGGIKTLKYRDDLLISDNNKAPLEYHSYGKADYDFWRDNYTRNYMFTRVWSEPDFMRPHLRSVSGRYKSGRFAYNAVGMTSSVQENKADIIVNLKIDDYCNSELGAPLRAQLHYSITDGNVVVKMIWIDKPASRLTEAIIMRFYPNITADKVRYRKIGASVDPYDIVVDGNRNISAVEAVEFNTTDSGSNNRAWAIINHHSPLASLGAGKILEFDNKYEDIARDGISFILQNNVWGTNFPLWYEGSAMFLFTLNIIK